MPPVRSRRARTDFPSSTPPAPTALAAASRRTPRTKPAVIGGNFKCLRVGQQCAARYQGAYRKYGFHCTKSRLQVVADCGLSLDLVAPVLLVPRLDPGSSGR